MILIGYSGHSYVINGILHALGQQVTGYCDKEEKKYNPLALSYFGDETSEEGLTALARNNFFISVGNNILRRNIYNNLAIHDLLPINVIHPSAIIDYSVQVALNGVMIAANVTINALVRVGVGAICNTGCILEHECIISDFVHIAPGAVLCGNVFIGENSLVGANSVIRENISVGKNVIIGTGSVVVRDVPDNVMVAGNPARKLN